MSSPWPNGAQAALAFSFDWESAMGGLDPLQGASTTYDATPCTGAGWRCARAPTSCWPVRQPTIRATFYATGYNLLDGNTERRQFAGNPTYNWAGRSGAGRPTYWTTHPWYGDDPYGTVQSDPAWYFGDQTDALHAAGHEIGSHTFGHLYVRGATPQELRRRPGRVGRGRRRREGCRRCSRSPSPGSRPTA